MNHTYFIPFLTRIFCWIVEKKKENKFVKKYCKKKKEIHNPRKDLVKI